MKNNKHQNSINTATGKHESHKSTTLRMKGLHMPRILIWLLGFFHGKILHTGGLDPDSQKISSAYISGQTKRFRAACVKRREKARAKLDREWTAADELIVDFKDVSSALEKLKDEPVLSNGTSTEARANEVAKKKRYSYESQLLAIKKRLSNTVNTVCSEIHKANDQMEATSDLLLSGFACYGHGMLMKPVFSRNLPEISFSDCTEQILKDHEITWNTIRAILDKEEVA